jgi:hypothetical protein
MRLKVFWRMDAKYNENAERNDKLINKNWTNKYSKVEFPSLFYVTTPNAPHLPASRYLHDDFASCFKK